MKEFGTNISVESFDQRPRNNITINITEITGVNPIKYNDGSTEVKIYYAGQSATLSRRTETETMNLYFKILKCIQSFNKSGNSKDYLVIYDCEPYLLSELDININNNEV